MTEADALTTIWDSFPKDLICQDQKVWTLVELSECVMNGGVLTEKHREVLKDYPESLKLLDYFASKHDPAKGRVRYHVSPGPNATPEEFAKALREVHEKIDKGLTINGIVDQGHPTVKIFANLSKEAIEKYKEACNRWVTWKHVEENRRWRNAYLAAGEPIPEEYGTPQPGDKHPIPPPPKEHFE